MKRLDHYWYSNNPVSLALLPLAWLFCALVELRRQCYRLNLCRAYNPPVPLIVVGNISVGGTGKTPLVLALLELLQRQGIRPGVVSRGYGGKAASWPQTVSGDSDPALVGDEPVLIAQRSGCPMVVGPDRVAAVQHLLSGHDIDVIVSDDGLQHYRLGRTVEIAVIDGLRRFGNGRCLPAGPLRERQGRLGSVDLRITNGVPRPGECTLKLVLDQVVPLHDGGGEALSAWQGRRVHAVAGIGHPQRFFDMLREQGLEVVEHPYADHHAYRAGELAFDDDLPVLMTEKDAVKYRAFAGDKHWYVPAIAEVSQAFTDRLLGLIKRKENG